MADSTTWLETIAAAQSQKEVTANALFDAASTATLFGRHAEACSGLTWGYYGGRLWDGSAAASIANATVSLTNTATNYVEATTAGVVSANTSAFTAGRIRIAKCVCSGGAVTSYEDHRTYAFPQASGIGSVTSVATGAGLTGGTITSTGTIALAAIADARLLANISGGSLAPSANTLTGIIDSIIGSTQGSVLYRSGAAWVALGPGSSGEFLKTQGAAANPTWSSVSGASGGTVTHTGGALTSNAVLLGAGTDDAKVVAGVTSDGTSKLNLGVAGASVGAVVLANATSGSITVQPPTGALGSVTVTIPAATDTLANLAGSQAFTNKTYNGNTWTAGTLTFTGASGKTFTVNNTLTLAGTDGKTLTVSNSITLAGTDSTTMTFPPASASVGYLNLPQNSQSTAYTTVLADSGKHLLHPTADTTARTFTIDSNANVAYPIGTAITFVNQVTAGVMTIAITTDTMRLAGAGTTGSRTLAANGIATALKVTSTEWIISGTGLT